MGKWDRRRVPRTRYYQEAPEPFHNRYYTESTSSGVWQNSMLLWEKQFCTSVGSIPWQKVVVAKDYMHFHNNVVNWNDSAGEKAFNNAKKQYWAAINGLPSDISVPDPDIYIGEIDWNPHIDPELMLEVDQEYFNPDEGGTDNKAETRNPKAHISGSGSDEGWHSNVNNGDNPWEGGNVKVVAQGWNQWGGSVSGWKNSDDAKNPWDLYTRDIEQQKDNTWGRLGDKSQGWNQGHTCNEQSNNFVNPWECGRQNVGSVKENGWGVSVCNSWGWNRRETDGHKLWKSNSGTFTQGNRGDKDGGWGDSGDKGLGWQGNQNNEPKKLDSRRNGGSWGALNGGVRKREGSHQYSSRYKSSRFRGDDCGTDCHWKGRNQNRASFA